ncbi:MAG: hypothetical protein PHX09_00425 [Clostridia bacterium]|nr:hypothetical protein [Clostridia bacterium]MDD4686127.1 hypothetical protein [Clostridia bacterium]
MADKKPVYIRCPRCELNYCVKKDKYCSVCKAEMNGNKDISEDLDLELCPICKTNYIQADEIMCATCLKERKHAGDDYDEDLEEEWAEYVNRDENEYDLEDEETGEMASVSELDDDILGEDLADSDLDFLDEEVEDEEEENVDYDDFEEIDIDDDDIDDEEEDSDDAYEKYDDDEEDY